MSTQKKLWMSGATALSAMSLALAPAVLAPSTALASVGGDSVLNSISPMAEPGTAVVQNTFNVEGDEDARDLFATKMEETEGILTYTFSCDSEENITQEVWGDPDFIRANGNFSTASEVDESLIGESCEVTGQLWDRWFETEDYNVKTELVNGKSFDLVDGEDTPLDWRITMESLDPFEVNPDSVEVRTGKTTEIKVLENDSVKADAPLMLSSYNDETHEFSSHESLELDEGTFTAVNNEDTQERYIEFTPADGYEGAVPSVDYWVDDPRAANLVDLDPDSDDWENRVRTLQTSSIDVNVVSAEAPESSPDYVTTEYDTPITFDPTENDTLNDPDATWEEVSLINTEGDRSERVVTEGGVFVSNDDNTITFTPEEEFSGEIFPVDYIAVDSNGNETYNTITVTVADPYPAESLADEAEGDEGEPITVHPLENDTVSQTATEWADLWLQNDEEENVKTITTEEGEYVVNDDLSVTFTGADDFTGKTSPMTYLAQDDAGETSQSVITFTVNPVEEDGDDNGDDEGTVDPGLTIDPEQISPEDFIDSKKGVNITAVGFTAGTEATLNVTTDSDNVRDFERKGTVDEDGTIAFESIYGVSSNADTYVGNYDVTVVGEGQDDLTGSFRVGEPSEGGGGNDESGGEEGSNDEGGGSESNNDSGDKSERIGDAGDDAEGARSDTGGELGASGKLGVLGGFAALSGALAWMLTRFGRKDKAIN